MTVRLIRSLLIAGLAGLLAACNLSATPPGAPTDEKQTPVAQPVETFEAAPTNAALLTTPTPLPGFGGPLIVATPIPAAQITLRGSLCDVVTAYSGSDPTNKLRLRSQPSVNADNLLLIPNNAELWLIPNEPEVEAEGYHWVHVIYVDPLANRYEGWVARDSYMAGGIRNPSISTLRTAGRQAAC